MKNSKESDQDCSFTSVKEIEDNDPLNILFKNNDLNKEIFYDENYSERKTIAFNNRFGKKELFQKHKNENDIQLTNEEFPFNDNDKHFGRNTISFENTFKKSKNENKKFENRLQIQSEDEDQEFDKNFLNRLGIEDIEEEVEDINNDSGYLKSILKEIQEEEIKKHICENDDLPQISLNVLKINYDNNLNDKNNDIIKENTNKNQVMVLVSELKDENIKKSDKIPTIQSNSINIQNNHFNNLRNSLEQNEINNKGEHDMKTRVDISMSKRTTTNSLNNNLNNNVLIQSFSNCNNIDNIRHTYDYGIRHNNEQIINQNFGYSSDLSNNGSFNPYGSLQMNSSNLILNNINNQDAISKSLPFNFSNSNFSNFNPNLNIANNNIFNYYNHPNYYSPQIYMNSLGPPMVNCNNLQGIYPQNICTNVLSSNLTSNNFPEKKLKKKTKKTKNKSKTKKQNIENEENTKNENVIQSNSNLYPNENFNFNYNYNKFDIVNSEIIKAKNSIDENVNFYVLMKDDKFILSVNTKEGSKLIQSMLDFYIKNNLPIPNELFMKFMSNNIFVFMNDRYGNYVLDRLILLMEIKHRKILYEDSNFRKNFVEICCGLYSNIVIQKLMKSMKSIAYEEEKIIELVLENIENLYNNKMANLCFHTIFDVFTIESSSKIVDILIKRLVKIANYNKFGHYLAKNFIITFKKKYDLYMKDVRMSYSKKASKKPENEGKGKIL